MKLSKDLVRRAEPPRPPRRGAVQFWLPGDPPTVTHHDKTIARRGRTGKSMLIDDPRLEAARAHYARLIPFNRDRVPLAAPLSIHLTFLFAADIPVPRLRVVKPDFDNSAKAPVDALVKMGWVVQDEGISLGDVAKYDVPLHYKAGVLIDIQSCAISDIPTIDSPGKSGWPPSNPVQRFALDLGLVHWFNDEESWQASLAHQQTLAGIRAVQSAFAASGLGASNPPPATASTLAVPRSRNSRR